MPTLRPDLEPFLDAFVLLSASRNANGTIPMSEVAAYLDVMKIDSLEEREEWSRFIRALDDEFLDWRRKPTEADNG